MGYKARRGLIVRNSQKAGSRSQMSGT